MSEQNVDIIIIGAGLGGIHYLHHLVELGFQNIKLIDQAPSVGGTWFYNTYPGAMSDTESYLYRYPWDEDQQKVHWSHHYLMQPEILTYINGIVSKHNLDKYIQLNTEMISATFDESTNHWRIDTVPGDVFIARYVVSALGLLSKATAPDIPGAESFRGRIVHSSSWGDDVVWADKKVGVIGCGSTGVQIITAIASTVKSMTCFQRNPQYSVPTGNKEVSKEYRDWVNANYDSIWDETRSSAFGFGFIESTRPIMSVSPEEREEIFEFLWRRGNGFRFMFSGFGDITTSKAANEEACRFIRKKITQTVKDPEKARKLMPHEAYARRPLCDSGYYEKFNQDNVDVVSLHDVEIAEITPEGIRTSDGALHELDLIVYATGFDAIDGSYKSLEIRGRGGRTFKEHWAKGAVSYMGIAVPNFPNFFMVNGPQGPFCNNPCGIEATSNLVLAAIKKAEEVRSTKGGPVVIEATPEAEESWSKLCDYYAEGSLFKETNSWIFGTNVPGQPAATRFFFPGLKAFRERVEDAIHEGFPGFHPIV